MSAPQNTRQGIWLMVNVTVVFAVQDAISRHLATNYNIWMILMVRYWFFAFLATALAIRSKAGIKGALSNPVPGLQIIRGLLLCAEMVAMLEGFVALGLVQTHAAFATYPLIIVALSGPVLGEKVGWKRWSAVCIGFTGVLIILQLGYGVISPTALFPLGAATLFALYGLLTRRVGQYDAAITSFFWTGIVGAIVMTLIGFGKIEPMSTSDMGFLAILCCLGMLSHWLLIRAYEMTEASAIQPFAYLQLLWATGIGVFIFNENLKANITIGATIVVCSGLFTLWRQRTLEQQKTHKG